MAAYSKSASAADGRIGATRVEKNIPTGLPPKANPMHRRIPAVFHGIPCRVGPAPSSAAPLRRESLKRG